MKRHTKQIEINCPHQDPCGLILPGKKCIGEKTFLLCNSFGIPGRRIRLLREIYIGIKKKQMELLALPEKHNEWGTPKKLSGALDNFRALIGHNLIGRDSLQGLHEIINEECLTGRSQLYKWKAALFPPNRRGGIPDDGKNLLIHILNIYLKERISQKTPIARLTYDVLEEIGLTASPILERYARSLLGAKRALQLQKGDDAILDESLRKRRRRIERGIDELERRYKIYHAMSFDHLKNARGKIIYPPYLTNPGGDFNIAVYQLPTWESITSLTFHGETQTHETQPVFEIWI